MDGLNAREVRAGAASAIVAESAAIPPHIRSRVLEVRSVYVPETSRKAGLGNALMRKLCADADIAGNALFLMPDGETDADTARLEGWYSVHGFVRIQDEPAVIMFRKPQQTLIKH
jgi:N-acetylglutamate synthase-like GNAT family acetyltransferase